MKPTPTFLLAALIPFTMTMAESSPTNDAAAPFPLFAFDDLEQLDSIDGAFDEAFSTFEETKVEESPLSPTVADDSSQMQEPSLVITPFESAPIETFEEPAFLQLEKSIPAIDELAAPSPVQEMLPEPLSQEPEMLVSPTPSLPEASLPVAAPKEEALPSPALDLVLMEQDLAQEEEIAPILNMTDNIPTKADEQIIAAAPLLTLETPPQTDRSAFEINLRQVFAGSPIIYSILLAMSMGAVFVWLYNLISLRYSGSLPDTVLKPIRIKLNSNQYEEALSLCAENNNLFCKMVATGIHSRRYGIQVMLEAMKAEGKRATTGYWQRMGLLNDIAIIAPMIGLLGTVLGMFYAFYDLNRTTESVTTLFDGLGISVGTTVAGLIVAILAMMLQSTAKYRLVRQLAKVENEAYSLATLIEHKTPREGGN